MWKNVSQIFFYTSNEPKSMLVARNPGDCRDNQNQFFATTVSSITVREKFCHIFWQWRCKLQRNSSNRMRKCQPVRVQCLAVH